MIDYREVAADLRRRWIANQPKGSGIAKGGFPAYGVQGQRPQTESTDEEEADNAENADENNKGGFLQFWTGNTKSCQR
jgi:hypothetical protein